MEDIELVIKIPQKWFDDMVREEFTDIDELCAVIQHGTLQPKTGRWIKSTGYDNRDHFYTCSECGRNINLICGAKLSDYPYCHCGAKMEEVEE